MSEKFTPGPWKADTFLVVAPNSHDGMSRMYGGKSVCHTGCTGNGIEESEANARLIAAAPELYKACKEALPYVTAHNDAEGMLDGFGPRQPRPSDGVLDQLRSALKKVEGE